MIEKVVIWQRDTTGVACMNLGRQFIFDIACERIENAQQQVKMFRDDYDAITVEEQQAFHL